MKLPHPFSFQDRRVVVTGAARGVGAALLDVLAELDVAHVTVLDLDSPSGPHDEFLVADLSDELGRSTSAAAREPIPSVCDASGTLH